jgi:RNA polymerase sigma factor (sigma-70 family)
MEPGEDRGDAQLEAIFRAQFVDLYRYIYRQVKNAAIAEDLTSAVFLKAIRWLQQGRSQESVKGWLYATARSAIADYWREHAQMHLLPLEEAEAMPALPATSDEQLRPLQMLIQRLLDGLSPRERDVLTLRYFQGYSAAEIGQLLGLSANHVRVLQLRALRRAALLETTERSVPVASPTLPYNQQAQRVLELSKEEARSLNHNYVGTEHLLMGILLEGSGAPELLNGGVTPETIRGGVLFIIGRGQEAPTSDPNFTPRTQEVLVLAEEEARRSAETAISPRHLLIAILREGKGIAAGLLRVSGASLQQEGETPVIQVVPDIQEGDLTLPADFQAALEQHPEERNVFERLSFTKKKDIVDEIERAEGEAARRQQVEKTLAMLHFLHQKLKEQGRL